MNIVDCKINEKRLQILIEKAESKGFANMYICMNMKTLLILEAQHYDNIILRHCDDIDLQSLNNNNKATPYYMGYPIAWDDNLEDGEVKIFGYIERPCTRITCYSDGTPPKIENNVTEKILSCVE